MAAVVVPVQTMERVVKEDITPGQSIRILLPATVIQLVQVERSGQQVVIVGFLPVPRNWLREEELEEHIRRPSRAVSVPPRSGEEQEVQELQEVDSEPAVEEVGLPRQPPQVVQEETARNLAQVHQLPDRGVQVVRAKGMVGLERTELFLPLPTRMPPQGQHPVVVVVVLHMVPVIPVVVQPQVALDELL